MAQTQTWPSAKAAGSSGPVFGDYSQAVLATSGLQSYWPLSDGGRSSKDYGPAALAAAFTAARKTENSVMSSGHVAADDKNALYRLFGDSVDSQVGDGTAYQFTGVQPFAIEAVCMTDASGLGGYRAIAGRNSSWVGGQVWFMGWSSTQLVMARSNGSGYDFNTGTHWTSGVKHHVVWGFDGSQMRAYIDGVLDFSVNSTRSVPASALPFRICSSAGISSPTVTAEKIAVYNTMPSLATIQAHAALI